MACTFPAINDFPSRLVQQYATGTPQESVTAGVVKAFGRVQGDGCHTISHRNPRQPIGDAREADEARGDNRSTRFHGCRRRTIFEEHDLPCLQIHLRQVDSQHGAIRLLMLTICRSGEVLSLRWEHVNLDRGELRLPDSKTGARIVHLGAPAIVVLRGIQRREDRPWVIPSYKRGAHLAFLHGPWRLILKRAEIEDLRIHDLRHSFASGALLVGEGLPMIGQLLGHNKVQTTARYAHFANDSVKSAANRIASRIAEVAG